MITCEKVPKESCSSFWEPKHDGCFGPRLVKEKQTPHPMEVSNRRPNKKTNDSSGKLNDTEGVMW